MIAVQSRRAGHLQYADHRGIASFPVLADIEIWWRTWAKQIESECGRQGWMLFILDANEKIMELEMLLSRLIRNKPEWDSTGWSQNEWLNVEDLTKRGLRWFEANAPQLDKVPEWAGFLLVAQYGNLCALARLGRELRAAVEQGYSTVVLERREDTLGGIAVTKGGDKFLAEVE